MWKLNFRYFCLSIHQIFLQSFLKLYLSFFADDRWLRWSRIFANGKGTKVESSYKVKRVFFLSSLAIINELILAVLIILFFRTLAEDTLMQLSVAHGLTGNVGFLKAKVCISSHEFQNTYKFWPNSNLGVAVKLVSPSTTK